MLVSCKKTKICGYCGNIFTTYRDDQNFCSIRCGRYNNYINSNFGKRTVIDGKVYFKSYCENCGKFFLSMHEQPYCSHKCFGESFGDGSHVGENHQGCKYHYNRDYFSVIDSPEKAYWIGFILGDGNLQKSTNYHLQFGVAKKDKQQLYNFIEEIGGSREQVKEKENMTQLRISSKEIYDDLVKIGIPEKDKSHVAKPLDIPYPNAFWLGLFDADGYAGTYTVKRKCKNGINEHKTFNVILVGTKSVCNGFSKFLGYNGENVYPISNVWRFSKGGKDIAKNIYDKLYKYDINNLTRKKERFIKMLKNNK